ncbi:CBS domain-containing protein [Sulfurihydrogenibium sp.]|uniref:CBS domain-containing protein n=1 Tax=Sulfurihydrogenibium sp. TaxID=2053621 RepID=UPI00260D91BC|nr:CBS domain-containing protein [Sulfurihydrogenibium sp.]
MILDEGADLDAFSSAYGLTLLYPDTYILLPNSFEYKVRKLLKIYETKIKDKVMKKEDLDLNKVEKVFLVDSQNVPDLIKNVPIEIFDHHPKKNFSLNKNVKKHLYKTGSISTVVVEKIKRKKISIDKDDATILSSGIYEDTGGFKFKGTTPRDIKAFYYLFKSGLDVLKLKKIVTDTFDLEDTEILKEIIKNTEPLITEDKKVFISSITKRYTKDIAWLLKYVKTFEEADAYFLVVNQKSKKVIIGRSKDEKIDVGKILSEFDGGGHPFAASAVIVGFDYPEIKNFLLSFLLGKQQSVLNFLKNDLPVVESNVKIREVKNILKDFKYAVVVEKGKYVGVLTEKVVNNAIKHKLENEDAITFSEEMITIPMNTNFIQLLKTFSSYNLEILPVVKKGYYKGVVYKKDFINFISGILEDKPVFQPISKPKVLDYSNKLREFFPKDIFNIIKEVGEYAEKLGYKAYIIGGVVRDIVMGKKSLDIDIIVEGSAVDLVRNFAKAKNLNFHIYPEFMTGNITLENKIKLDFATARKEEYESPGSYPRVEKASLFEDLYRRDFTINTLAIEITKSNFGKLIDYFNGFVDIKEKRIRVLHTLSFVEDPIRILRGLRFAGRFNFKLEKKTQQLLNHAIEKDLLNFAPTGRINLELNLTFNEEKVIDILILMDKYKILYKLFSGLSVDSVKKELLIKLKDNFLLLEKLLNTSFPKASNYLYILLSGFPLEVIFNYLKKYHFEKEAKYINDFYTNLETISQTQEKFKIYQTIKSFNKDFLPALLTLLNEDKLKIILDIVEKEKNPLIKGEDLIQMGLKPSRIFKEILDDTFKRYLENSLKTKEDALSYIKKKYLQRVENEDTDSRR